MSYSQPGSLYYFITSYPYLALIDQLLMNRQQLLPSHSSAQETVIDGCTTNGSTQASKQTPQQGIIDLLRGIFRVHSEAVTAEYTLYIASKTATLGVSPCCRRHPPLIVLLGQCPGCAHQVKHYTAGGARLVKRILSSLIGVVWASVQLLIVAILLTVETTLSSYQTTANCINILLSVLATWLNEPVPLDFSSGFFDIAGSWMSSYIGCLSGYFTQHKLVTTHSSQIHWDIV